MYSPRINESVAIMCSGSFAVTDLSFHRMKGQLHTPQLSENFQRLKSVKFISFPLFDEEINPRAKYISVWYKLL